MRIKTTEENDGSVPFEDQPLTYMPFGLKELKNHLIT